MNVNCENALFFNAFIGTVESAHTTCKLCAGFFCSAGSNMFSMDIKVRMTSWTGGAFPNFSNHNPQNHLTTNSGLSSVKCNKRL